MSRYKKKSKSKFTTIIPIAIVLVAIIGVVIFISNNNDNSILSNNSKKDIIQQAEILDWVTVYKEIKDNPAKSEDYEGKLYFYYGSIYDISVNYVTILNSNDAKSLNNGTDSYIYVYLDKEIIKTLNKNDIIYVIGTLKKANSTWTIPCDLKNCILLDTETVKNNFVMKLTEEKSNSYGVNNKYSKYEYNKETGMIISYKQSGDTNGTHTLSYDSSNRLIEDLLEKTISSYGSEKTTYTYDENNNILTEDIIEIKNGVETPKQHWDYTYILDEQDRVIKKTGINTLGDNYTMIYEFTYNEDNNIIEEIQTSPNSTYKVKYEYDKFGNKTKSTSSRVDKVGSSSITTYSYSIIGKK